MNRKRPHLPDPESKPEYIQQGFDSIARRYDLLNDLMTGGLHRRWKRETVRRLDLPQNGLVLDLCAGTGDLAYRAIEAMSYQGHAAALDFSPEMILVGRQRETGKNVNSNLSWVRGDATSLPFSDKIFDGAMVGFGLRNVISIEATLREVLRVLKPGAKFVSLDTAGVEWKIFSPFYAMHINWIVPALGKFLTGSKEMYAYLTASAAAFDRPDELGEKFKRAGFTDTSYIYRPRFLGGAALVWGTRPS